MVVKCSLFFRSFLQKKDKDGNDYLQVSFLDEQDEKYIFNFPLNEENKKYMKMAKDTKCDFNLVLYEPRNKDFAKYSFYAK